MADPVRIMAASTERLPEDFALWRLGFRPFYLLASIFAAASVALWALQYTGWLRHAYLAGPLAHAHEMLFGFTLAVVAGFLFTAVRNWTVRPTPTGAVLAAIAALWLAGRVLVLTPYGWAAAAVNVAFPIAVAASIGIPLFRSRNRRNYFFVGLLALLALAEAGVHLAQLGVVALPGWVGIRIALDAILFLMVVMAGRVVPMFTNNGVPGAGARRHPLVEWAALGSVIALLAADAAGVAGLALFGLLVFAALVHAVRLALWRPWNTLRTPLVWVLHLAYAWIVIHLALRALAELGLAAAPLATHALTVGAIGLLTIGMMTRTARGHTGRPLVADRYEVVCYLLILAAAVVRVFGPAISPSAYMGTVALAAIFWSGAYALYAVRYWPVLTRARLDGKPG